MSFYPDLDRLNLEQLMECFQQPAPEEEDASMYYMEVALSILQHGNVGVDYLYQTIDQADTEELRAILFALAEYSVEPEKLRFLLLNYLDDRRPIIVAEAIDGLCKLGDKDTLDRVLPMLEHPDPYVRGSVLRFVASLHPDRALPLLLEKLKDPDFIVRENAVDELGDLGIVSAIPYLTPLLEDDSREVRQAAQTAINSLQGSY
jgi:HEAT repeat protein